MFKGQEQAKFGTNRWFIVQRDKDGDIAFGFVHPKLSKLLKKERVQKLSLFDKQLNKPCVLYYVDTLKSGNAFFSRSSSHVEKETLTSV